MGEITKKVAFTLTDSGTIVAAVANARLRIVQITFTCNDNQTVCFEGTNGTDITGTMPPPADTGWGMCTPPNHYSGIGPDTQVGEGIKVTLGGAMSIAGALVYQEIG